MTSSVIVTGGASGIGAGVVERLSGRRRTYVLDKTPTGGLSYQVDVTDQNEVASAIADVFDREEQVEGLVNVAGAARITKFLDLSPSGWQRAVDVNLTGVFYCMQEFARQLVERGQPGSIVTVTSINQSVPVPGLAGYSAAKAGAAQLSRVAALELGHHRIRANVVAPGPVETPMMMPLLAQESLREAFVASTPLGRIGEVDDIAAAVEFLLDPDASWITGQSLIVDGGMSLVGEPSPNDYMSETSDRSRPAESMK